MICKGIPIKNLLGILAVVIILSAISLRFVMVQPVPEKMRFDMVIEMESEILDGHHRSLYKWLI